jgi:hypothetical protein
MKNPLVLFSLLQVLDIATTLVALGLGGSEKNPFVSQMMAVGPVYGLLISKLAVIGIAGFGALLGKYNGIRLANLAFSAIVVWNLTIIFRLAIPNQKF